ncbi:MAG: CCA tRNA nucleotidyltransferase [bacterium]
MKRDAEARRLLTAVAEAAKRSLMTAYLVGGAVRDRLLGLASTHDLDFVVEQGSALELARLTAEELDAPPPVLFPRFHTAQVFLPPWKLEFVDARRESYAQDSRKPQVERASLLEDLQRRDFTINTLAQELESGRLIDLLDGRKDLQRRLLRTPLDPDETLRDDPLRMLRAVRFAASLGFSLESGLEEAVRRQAATLWGKVSPERVKVELDSILLSPLPANAIILLDRVGLLQQILPELEAAKQVPQDKVQASNLFHHSLVTLQRAAEFLPNPVSPRERYAALLHDLGKIRTMREEGGVLHFHGHSVAGAEMASAILSRLRSSGEEIEEVSFLIRWHMLPAQYAPDWSDAAVKRLIRRLGPLLKATLRLSRADIYGIERQEHDFWHLVKRIEAFGEEKIQQVVSPLNGEEIMALFSQGPGAFIGRIKEELVDAVLEGTLEDSPRAARAYLRRKYQL